VRLASLGEILWDVIGDSELLGGATFNFSVQLTRLGHDVAFLSAVGNDERGRRALAEAARLGLDTGYIHTVTGAPTGYVTVTVDAAGQPSYVLHRPAAYDFVSVDLNTLETPAWIYHGTLQLIEPRMRALLARLTDAFPRAKRFYDINLRRDSYNAPLLMDLLHGANVVKLNDDEVLEMAKLARTHHASLEAFCRDWAARHKWQAVCVTRGAHGCAILLQGEYVEVPGVPVKIADTVGAGDAFAAAFLHGLDAGWPAEKIGAFANRLGALVASRAGGVPEWSLRELGL
jgi:fructokinase